jgi:DNA-binding NarL/FixJ family response regulator
VISVVVADDQGMVRRGLVSLLGMEPDIEIVGEAADGEAAVRTILESNPDVALLDIRMPMMDGIEAMRRLTAAGCPARLLALTTFDLDEYVYEALKAGASGFLLKDASVEDLAAAIRVVASGEAVLAPAVTRRVINAFATSVPRTADASLLEGLTPREREVLTLIARGYSNAEIAEALVLTSATVKTHVSSLLSKLHFRDRVHAVIVAYECGLIAPGQ